MISRLFRVKILLTVFISLNALGQQHDTQYSFEFEQKMMREDWNFLPSVPASFQSSDDISYQFGARFGDFGLVVEKSELELDLQRSTEPKDVSLTAKKYFVEGFYRLTDSQKVSLFVQQQKANEQRFDCYSFSNITVGSCLNADIQIGSSNPKYDHLEGSLIAINGDTKTVGFEFEQQIQRTWLDSVSIGLSSTKHEYSWLTPIEDIQSPFLLNLVINGNTLGDVIQQTLSQLPQRDPWKLNQVNVRFANAFSMATNFEFFYALELVYLQFKDYQSPLDPPQSNAKLNMGVRLRYKNLGLEVFSNLYQHNLLGFEPITFNQRTEHYFRKAYGDIGINVKVIF